MLTDEMGGIDASLTEEMAEELRAEFLMSDVDESAAASARQTVPMVQPTPLTKEVLSTHGGGGGGGSAGGGGGSGGGGGNTGALRPLASSADSAGGADIGGNVPKKGRWESAPSAGSFMAGVPMARSGVSNLLDDLNLEQGLGTRLGGEGASSLSVPEERGGADTGAGTAAASSSAGAEGMEQEEADRYVQVITSGEEPFQIVWASEAWLRLCEYRTPQVLGHTLEIIQGPRTSKESVSQLMGAIRKGEPITLAMTNHTRTGKAFSHMLRVEPLRDSRGSVQCFQATSSNIDENPPDAAPGADHADSGMGDEGADRVPALASTAGAESTASLPSLIRRTESEQQLSAMLPRNNSELILSEMLDLFDQEQLSKSPEGSFRKRAPHDIGSSPLLPPQAKDFDAQPASIPPVANLPAPPEPLADEPQASASAEGGAL